MNSTIFINDGMTKDGHIEAAPGLHGAVAFTYRPALAEARYEFLRVREDGGKAYMDRASKLLAKHVVSWDAAAGDGQSIEITPDVCKRLHPNVLNELLDHVLGYKASEQRELEKNSPGE